MTTPPKIAIILVEERFLIFIVDGRENLANTGKVSHEVWNMHRGCLRKKAYWTLEHAKEVAKKVEERTGIKMHCYYCNLCGRYHLTKQEVTGTNKGF